MLTDMVDKPQAADINTGLSPLHQSTVMRIYGPPADKPLEDDTPITNLKLRSKIVTRNVGPFSVTGHIEAVRALMRVFLKVKAKRPDLYAAVGTAGMLNARLVRGSKTSWSNHCLPYDQEVWTEDGPKSIGSLENYQGKVWSFDNGKAVLKKITNFFKNGENTLLEIQASGKVIKCTSEHPILVMKKKTLDKKDWVKLEGGGHKRAEYWTEMVKAKDLVPGDRIVAVREIPTKGVAENEDWAEVLGLFIGDGCVGHRDGVPEYVSFSIPKEDRIRTHAKELLTRYFNQEPKSNDHFLTYYTPEIVAKFNAYDKLARAKTLPNEVWGWNEEAQLRFVLGYLYSDGCIIKAPSNKSGDFFVATHQYKAGSKELIRGLKMLLTMLGFRCSKVSYEKPHDKVICGVNTRSEGSWCFRATDLENKITPKADSLYMERLEGSGQPNKGTTPCWGYETLLPNFTHVKVNKIVHLPAEEVFDMEVEDTHNFITDGVVVSNSWGFAVDLLINGKLDVRGDGKVMKGLLELYPFFRAEGFWWGAEFDTEDAMHFEVADETVLQWEKLGWL